MSRVIKSRRRIFEHGKDAWWVLQYTRHIHHPDGVDSGVRELGFSTKVELVRFLSDFRRYAPVVDGKMRMPVTITPHAIFRVKPKAA